MKWNEIKKEKRNGGGATERKEGRKRDAEHHQRCFLQNLSEVSNTYPEGHVGVVSHLLVAKLKILPDGHV